MNYEEYKKEAMDEVYNNAKIQGMLPDEYFLNDKIEALVSMGEFVDPQINSVYKELKNKRKMEFDAFAFDNSDKSFILITNDFTIENENLTKTDIEKLKNRMLCFVELCYEKKLKDYFSITDDILKIGANIGERLRRDYVDAENDDSIDKVKLYIITNKNLSNKIKYLPIDEIYGKRVETSIWSMERFYELYSSGRDREQIVIETNKYGVDGLPCIKADMSDNTDYDAYLAIVPGKFLNDIYYDHGSRLLEGNVRAFLSNRGKINKGIRETIRKEPTKFFTYNNGIACTAADVTLSDDKRLITKIDDLQIINGGQTTASLTSAKLKDGLSLDNIFVPMKLTIVKNDDYDEMIQNISRYANSQNKVTEADLFSNHPFHRTFEELSKKIQTPVTAGSVISTYWYYERARGKYEQEQFKLIKKTERDAFIAKFPKSQVIKKEELARYYTCSELLRPDVVSKGAQKAMSFFAECIDEKYKKDKEYFNEAFYKRCISDTILFRLTDKIVKEASWYKTGGYKLNIVPYTISKLVSLIPKGKCLDYNKIWKNQELYSSLNHEIEKIAKMTNDFIQCSDGVIVTEYCKKEDTWKKYKTVDYEFSQEFIDDLSSVEFESNEINSAKKTAKLYNDIEIQNTIYELGGEYWRKLIEEGKKRRLLTPSDIALLSKPASFDSPRPKLPNPVEVKKIWEIRKKLDEAGVMV